MIRQLACVAFAGALISFASGPEDRKVTDPKSIVSPANTKARAIPIDDLYFSRSVFDPAWSPDSSQLAFVCDLTGRLNIWKMPVGGGWPVQMVQSEDRQFGPLWSKDGKWIVYQQDQGGGEYFDLYAVPANGGEPVNLTNTPDISETASQFSPDGKTLAISLKSKAGSNVNIALFDWESRKIRKLTDEPQPDRLWSFDAWSPDGKTIYADRGNVAFTDSDVYAVDVATGKMENLTPHKGDCDISRELDLTRPQHIAAHLELEERVAERRSARHRLQEADLGYRYEVGGRFGRFHIGWKELFLCPQCRRANGGLPGGPGHAPTGQAGFSRGLDLPDGPPHQRLSERQLSAPRTPELPAARRPLAL